MDNQDLTMNELDSVAGGLIHEGAHAGSSASTGGDRRDRIRDGVLDLLRKMSEIKGSY